MSSADQSLIDRFLQGDQDAATELYRRYLPRLVVLVNNHLNEKFRRRLDTDDLVQTVFKSAFRQLKQQPQQFVGEAGFWKWLLTVALNKVFKRIEHERAQKRDPGREVVVPEDADFDSFLATRLAQSPRADEVVSFADLFEAILERLDPEEKQILQLRLDGQTQNQIGQRIGVSSKTIRRRMDDIRAKAAEVVGQTPPPFDD